MLKKLFIASSVLAMVVPAIAFAHSQVSAPQAFQDPVDAITIPQLLDNSIQYDEHNVAVQGVVAAQLSHDEYIIIDKSSHRHVQIDLEDNINAHTALKKGMEIRVFGEFDQGEQPEIEVVRLEVAKA